MHKYFHLNAKEVCRTVCLATDTVVLDIQCGSGIRDASINYVRYVLSGASHFPMEDYVVL